jgi:prolyl oligopeptidase PreP (S9A serine peptidase family)
VWLESKDGTQLPLFLVSPKNLKLSGDTPVLLSGYGGFGISIEPAFSSKWLPWLEAGGIIAIPSLRGGGEFGEQWHQQGTRNNKQNVFDDFISSAEWLIGNNYTNTEQLTIEGGSNGGLLVGAAVTQRPDLFKGVVSAVPLLDMLRFHKFRLGSVWKGEYGCSENETQFSHLLSYSPYHNIVDGREYPATLLYAGKNDFRVDPMHVRKMAARLQAAAPKSARPLIMDIDEFSGHVPTSSQAYFNYTAKSLSFLMEQVTMPNQSFFAWLLAKEPPLNAKALQLKRVSKILSEQKEFENEEEYIEEIEKAELCRQLEKFHENQKRVPTQILPILSGS